MYSWLETSKMIYVTMTINYVYGRDHEGRGEVDDNTYIRNGDNVPSTSTTMFTEKTFKIINIITTINYILWRGHEGGDVWGDNIVEGEGRIGVWNFFDFKS